MLSWTPSLISPQCPLAVVASENGIRRIWFDAEPPREHADEAMRDDRHPLLAEARAQLSAYFNGRLREFDLPLDMVGTPFQKRVWRALVSIPYAETRSYAAIAALVGSPQAMRAVGAANGRNPVPVVVPCHRVIGSNGSLVGFGGGLDLKKFLLSLEARNVERERKATA